MDANFPTEEIELSASELMEALCRRPVYLEFPQGSPLVGAFLGCARIPEEISPTKHAHHQFIASLIYMDSAEILFSAVINDSVKKILRRDLPKREFSIPI